MTTTANLTPPTLSDFESLARTAWEQMPGADEDMHKIEDSGA